LLLLTTLAIAPGSPQSNFRSAANPSAAPAAISINAANHTFTFTGTGTSQEEAVESARDLAERTIGGDFKVVSQSFRKDQDKWICTLMVALK